MQAIGLIPVRLESSRLPRKALADICGLPMVVHVLRRCQMAYELSDVVVATDSEEVKRVVEANGGRVLMTGAHHQTGTDRLAEAAQSIECDIVVNIQGDEALVMPEHVDASARELKRDPSVDVSILVSPYDKRNVPSDIKAVLDERDNVLYLSRADLPSDARTPSPPMLKAYHVVSFRKPFLLQFASWSRGRLETIEFNEYLRILEKGHRIRAVHVESTAISVDTPEDLAYVRSVMRTDPLFPRYA